MPRRSFLDTNVLIYSVDRAFPEKQEVALTLIAKHAIERTGVISTQVLQEFFSAATRKLGIPPIQARQQLHDFRVFDIVQITPEIIEQGVDCSIVNAISFWDGLIITCASVAKCHEVISEDLSNRQRLQGMPVRNPFA